MPDACGPEARRRVSLVRDGLRASIHARPAHRKPHGKLTPFQYLFLVYCSVEKLMHQRPNPIPFFFQREMARVEQMELCTGNISFKEFSTLHRKDSIVF